MTIELREATSAELATWDSRTVDPPDGSVYQSRAWGEHSRSAGWSPRYLVGGDAYGLLALVRPWPALGGGSAYLPRGPVSAGSPPEAVVERLRTATAWLGRQGVDVVASDAEVAAASGYPALLRSAGFRPIEEIQPSRHGMTVALGGLDERTARHGISTTVRQRIAAAERWGAVVRRFDARASDGPWVAPMAVEAEAAAASALDDFYVLLAGAGRRRGFALGSRQGATAWWLAALRAGHLVYLEIRQGEPGAGDQPGLLLGGSVFYRHGGRLTYAHSADRPDLRDPWPGVIPLILWRAFQIALGEGRQTFDLGGVDVAGARELPQEGDRMWGLYQFKRWFGAEWVEMTGAHERVIRPNRYRAGRAAARLARLLGRAGSAGG